MASRALSIGALALATPIAANAAPTPKLTVVPAATFAPWTQDRRARLLLASCIANPPLGEWKRARYVRSEDSWFSYVGYRAEALEVIYMEAGTRARLHYEATGEYGPFERWCSEPNATDAIDAALSAAAREG